MFFYSKYLEPFQSLLKQKKSKQFTNRYEYAFRLKKGSLCYKPFLKFKEIFPSLFSFATFVVYYFSVLLTRLYWSANLS
jgi:hypothetical protein